METTRKDPRVVVHGLAAGIEPIDEHEVEDRASTLRWIRSGAQLFRTARPATPDRHLCVYFAVLDQARRSILMVDHVKAGLWLFAGGHVDDGEDPRATVIREAAEELNIDARFHPSFGCDPLFLSVTKTRGDHTHTDVSFWFIIDGDEAMTIKPDRREANCACWFRLDDPRDWTTDRFDPHMTRFRRKLVASLGVPVLVG